MPKQVNRPKPKNKDDTICPICLSSSTVARKRIDVFWPTCCKPPSSLIHRPCLQVSVKHFSAINCPNLIMRLEIAFKCKGEKLNVVNAMLQFAEKIGQ